MSAASTDATGPAVDQSTAWWGIGLGVLASLAITWGIAAHVWIVGSVEGGWVYPYGRRASVSLVAGWVAASAAVAAFALLAFRASHRSWLAVAMWVLFASAWHVSVRGTAPHSLEQLFTSDRANSFHSVARQYTSAEVLGQFSQVRASAPLHVQSNMPGKVLLIQALQHISERTDVLPWLIVALSNLGAFLMYGFVRDLFEDAKAGLYASALYLFLPSRFFFFPLQNTVTPLVIIAFSWLIVRWLATARTLHAALAGLALYGLAIFEPLPLVAGLLFLTLAVAAIHRGTMAWDRAVFHVGIGAIAFIAIAELVDLLFGFNIVRAFRSIGRHAMEFNASAGRPYGTWVVRNLWEFAFGFGFCQAIILVVALVSGLSKPGAWSDRLSRPLTCVTIGLLTVLAATDLLGINRGEVIRLWTFLGALFQIPTAYVCARLNGPAAIALVLGVTALHTAAAASLIRFVLP